MTHSLITWRQPGLFPADGADHGRPCLRLLYLHALPRSHNRARARFRRQVYGSCRLRASCWHTGSRLAPIRLLLVERRTWRGRQLVDPIADCRPHMAHRGRHNFGVGHPGPRHRFRWWRHDHSARIKQGPAPGIGIDGIDAPGKKQAFGSLCAIATASPPDPTSAYPCRCCASL